MILDNLNKLNNKSQIKTVWEYLHKYTKGENLNIVSGFCFLKSEIDYYVYKVYNLTYDEIINC